LSVPTLVARGGKVSRKRKLKGKRREKEKDWTHKPAKITWKKIGLRDQNIRPPQKGTECTRRRAKGGEKRIRKKRKKKMVRFQPGYHKGEGEKQGKKAVKKGRSKQNREEKKSSRKVRIPLKEAGSYFGNGLGHLSLPIGRRYGGRKGVQYHREEKKGASEGMGIDLKNKKKFWGRCRGNAPGVSKKCMKGTEVIKIPSNKRNNKKNYGCGKKEGS